MTQILGEYLTLNSTAQNANVIAGSVVGSNPSLQGSVLLISDAAEGVNIGGFTGQANVVLGSGCQNGITGNYNVVIGNNLVSNTQPSCTSLIAIGNGTAQYITSGDYNTAIGGTSLFLLTTGTLNTAIGQRAGFSHTTGSNCTYLGANCNTSGVFTQSTALGTGSLITASNQIMMGSSTEAVTIPGTIMNNSAAAVVNGSTSGTATWTQPDQGSAYKKVMVYLNVLLGTATFTFTTAFVNTPSIVTTNGPASGVVTSLSNTAVTITGASTTGFIILEGF